jgi:ATP-binding cassette, subfamily B, bacterial PglK
MTTIIKLISLFTPHERRRLIPLTLAILLMSALEVAGISSLGPFMAVVADPTVVQTNPILSAAYEFGGFQSSRAFLIALGLAVFAVVLIATAFKMLVLYALYRFVGNRRYTLGLRLFRQYLYQPYSYFLDHNSSELSKNLLTEVDQVINGVLRPLMESFAKGVLALAILVFLIVTNPWVALGAAGVMGTMYGAIYSFVRPRLMRHGVALRESNRLRFKAAGEAFGAIKDVKILGKEPSFAHMYGTGARRFARTQAAQQILSTLPGHAMQSMSVGFAIALVVIMLATTDSLVTVLPLLAIYAFAVQRMMPNLQAVFQGVAQIRYYSHTVDALHQDMTSMPLPPAVADHKAMRAVPEVRPFRESIEIRNLSFRYPASREMVLADLNLMIHKNTTVGFVGTTGCGKTTLVDVIMGLLEPVAGVVAVDGAAVSPPTTDSPIGPWQRNFGYVPQQIYLGDDTVAANIALGIPEDMRSQEAVEHAARVANLHEFVVTELPNGYETVVGERGIRLSGGQRQRVGIARALYHDPDILVMDEATSALDTVTEDAVMDAIHNLMHTKTIIIIAHRITTVRECDVICLMERGRIVAQGKYDELIRENERFRAMAKVAVG